MARKISEKKQKSMRESVVSRLYGQRCFGIQINIMDIGKVMRVGVEALEAGDSEEAAGDKIAAFVEKIRKN